MHRPLNIKSPIRAMHSNSKCRDWLIQLAQPALVWYFVTLSERLHTDTRENRPLAFGHQGSDNTSLTWSVSSYSRWRLHLIFCSSGFVGSAAFCRICSSFLFSPACNVTIITNGIPDTGNTAREKCSSVWRLLSDIWPLGKTRVNRNNSLPRGMMDYLAHMRARGCFRWHHQLKGGVQLPTWQHGPILYQRVVWCCPGVGVPASSGFCICVSGGSFSSHYFRKRLKMRLSSLPFQILLFFNRYLSAFYIILELSVLIWKRYRIPYPGSSFSGEVCFLLLMIPIEAIRNFTGKKRARSVDFPGTRGNKLIQNRSLVFFVALSIPSTLCYVYFLHWQIYVYAYFSFSADNQGWV